MTETKRDFFEELFDRTTFNQRRMILLLNETNGSWVTAQWLSEKLSMSKRATLGVMNELSDKINEINPEKFHFEFSRGRGVRLQMEKDADVHQLAAEVVRSCHTVRIFEELLTEEFDNIRNYALDNYISESTVRRCLSRIRHLLKRYHIELGRENNHLVGEEQQIRMFMMTFFWSIYRGRSWPFKHVNEQRVETYVDQVLNSEFTVHPKIPYAYKKQVAYIFAEGIIRARKGKLVKFSPEVTQHITINALYPRFESIMSGVDDVSDIKISEIPFFFLVWLSMSKTTEIFTEPVLSKLIEDQAEKQTQIYQATEWMLSRFQEKYFVISQEKIWRFRACVLSSHCFAYYFKGFNMDTTGNTYKEIFSENFPCLIQKTSCFIDDLYQESKNPIFLEKDYLLIPYLKNILFLDDPCKYEVPITMLVESDMPSLLTNNLIQQINGYFSYLYNLTVADSLESEASEVDILLTTGILKDIEKTHPEAEVVVVGKKLSVGDLEKISQALKEVSEKKRSDLSIREGNLDDAFFENQIKNNLI